MNHLLSIQLFVRHLFLGFFVLFFLAFFLAEEKNDSDIDKINIYIFRNMLHKSTFNCTEPSQLRHLSESRRELSSYSGIKGSEKKNEEYYLNRNKN